MVTFPNECPLGKYESDPTGITGSLTADPVEKCLGCNFADTNNEYICKCPSDMMWSEYDKLRDMYANNVEGELTKAGFQIFVGENYPLKD